jgi:hypothetical protein
MDDTATPETETVPAAGTPPHVGRRLNRAFGPIVAGVILDLLDLAPFGPLGYVHGLPLGGLMGYWLGRCLGLGRKASVLCAFAAGVYCTFPFTGILPLATLVGAYARFRESGTPQTEETPDENAAA